MDKKGDQKEDESGDDLYSVFGDGLFLLVPFLVIAVVFVYLGKNFNEFVLSPEWSFGNSVIFGQVVVRVVESFIKSRTNVIHQRASLGIALILIFGLVPSLTVLTLILVSASPPLWLGIIQIILFILATGTFIVFGSVAKQFERRLK